MAINIGNAMPETITIPKKEYKALKEKAAAFEKIADSERLSKKELSRIRAAKRNRLLSEKSLAKDWLRKEEDMAWKNL